MYVCMYVCMYIIKCMLFICRILGMLIVLFLVKLIWHISGFCNMKDNALGNIIII